MSSAETLAAARARVQAMSDSGATTLDALSVVLAEALASKVDKLPAAEMLEFTDMLLKHLRDRFAPLHERLDEIERRLGD